MSSASPIKLSLLLTVILGAISALTPLAIDMYLPALPGIAQELGVTPGAVQITLTAYTAGFAVGQLLHGPLADSYGRRPVLIIGTLFFALAAMLSATTDSIESLTWVRAGQGFAGAAAAVVIQAIVRDMFAREDYARTMSFILLVMTLAPLVAPLIGGYMSAWFGWRSIFWLLAFIALVVIIAVLWKIPETLAVENRPSFSLRASIRHYVGLFICPQAVGLIFSGAFSFAGMFAFLTAGSFIYIELYGIDIKHVGYLFALNVLLMMVMTSVNGSLVKKMGSHWMLRFGLSIQLSAGVLLVAAQILNLGLWGTVIPVMMFVSTVSVIGSNSMALLLNDYPHIAGTASSLAGTLRFAAGALAAAGISAMPATSAWPMVFVMLVCAILSISVYWLFAKEV